MTNLYTVELTITDGTVCTAGGMSAADAHDLVATLIDQTGECKFVTTDGVYAWPWYDIASCKVTRQISQP